jgi:cellulose synthase (UDP-forming)
LPAFIGKSESDKVLGLVEDISADGCRFISENPVAANGTVSGEIFLPSGRMPFTASTSRHLEPVVPSGDSRDTMKETGPRTSRRKLEYGLAFQWKSAHDAIQLENFLYGSDLQWRILDLQEGVTTPVAWVVDLFARGKMVKVSKISSEEWLPVIYHQTRKGEQQDKFGVLSRTDWTQKPARLIMFESVRKGSRLEIYIFGNMPQNRVQGELIELQKLQTTIAEIYVAKIMLQPQGPDEVSRS